MRNTNATALQELTDQTISDFGEQWNHFTENTGYYGSTALLLDILGPSVTENDLQGIRVADIGSGTGRIVNMLIGAGVSHVTAVEPSAAFEVMLQNTKMHSAQITYIKQPGEQLPVEPKLDMVISLGVIHHIPHPVPVLQAARDALKEGGRLIIWLYGYEGNEAYLAVAKVLRAITKRIPHKLLLPFAKLLAFLMAGYGKIAKTFTALPMSEYFAKHFNLLSFENKVLTIYDQLNPAYAKYYKKQEAYDLVAGLGFKDVQLHHRHGYSWTVSAKK
jgi:SAM-dependent methyltransferase